MSMTDDGGFSDDIINEAAARYGIKNMTPDWWRRNVLPQNELFRALCQAVSEIRGQND